jgi:hypothetical protein
MTRSSDDYYQDGRLWDGYDYENQAWVKDGKYVNCGHPESQDCQCYGRLHAGEETKNLIIPKPDKVIAIMTRWLNMMKYHLSRRIKN